jgi:hypothetical protein
MSEENFYRTANLIHNCAALTAGAPTEGQSSSKERLKTLLLMVDNRAIDLNSTIDQATYFLLNTVINLQYAKKHGYDLVVLRLNSTGLVEDVELVYHQSGREIDEELRASLVTGANIQKTGIALFNPFLGEQLTQTY